MNFDLKKLNNISNMFSKENLNLWFYAFLQKGIGKLLWFLFFLSMLYCIYIWYFYINNPQWNSERKDMYVKSKSRETILDQNNFSKIVNEMEKRKEKYDQSSPELGDIFRLSN